MPAYYVFNRKHELRHIQAGDEGYDRIVTAIERMLDEREDVANATIRSGGPDFNSGFFGPSISPASAAK